METKVCSICGGEFSASLEFFHKKGNHLDHRCKACCKKYKKKYFKSEKGKQALRKYERSEKGRSTRKAYFASEHGKEKQRKYLRSEKGLKAKRRYGSSEKGRKVAKRYRQSEKGRKKARIHWHKRYKENKLSYNMSSLMRYSLRANKDGHHWEDLVDYNLKQLKEHLESLWQPGMCWDNHTVNGWHIDHIRPISSFNIISYECDDFKKCWSLENLQPLWAKDNLKKSNKIIN